MRRRFSLLVGVGLVVLFSLLALTHDASSKRLFHPLVPSAPQSGEALNPDSAGDTTLIGDAGSDCGGGAPGMANPASVYCRELGYEYKVVDAGKGQNGECVFPDGSVCDEWAFLGGKCGQSYSYCAQHGYDQVTKEDGKNTFSREYSVCVDNGREVGAVSELAELSDKSSKGAVPLPQSTSSPDDGSLPTAVPASFDWRNHDGRDWMTPIKNQGSCGSCWAFASVGAVEAMYNIGTGNPLMDLDLSEEYLVSDCDSYEGTQNCCGGWPSEALDYIRNYGIPDEQCLPYVDSYGCTCGSSCSSSCAHYTGGSCSNAACSDRCSDWRSRLVRIAGEGSVSSSAIKQSVANTGPVVVLMGVQDKYGAYWDGDIYRCSDDSGTNHSVVIVGYDDAGGYWIVRNSWGSSWGDDGYFKVGYGECAIGTDAYYVQVGRAPVWNPPLPDVQLNANGSCSHCIDLWAYTQDDVTPDSLLAFSVRNASADLGVTMDSNRYIDIDPRADWCGEGYVTVRATDEDGAWAEDAFRISVVGACACKSYFSPDTPMPIPDLSTVVSTTSVADSFSVLDTNATINITHTWDSDLRVYLRSPSGTGVKLFAGIGGSYDNFADTVLDDDCSTEIASGAAPFSGCYRPQEALSGVSGESSSGAWSLEVTDAAGGDVGTIESWQLQLCSSASVLGDVNGDGYVTMVDAMLTAQYVAGLIGSGALNLTVADVNCSGGATMVDAMLVAQKVAGLISDFPACGP